MFVPAPSSLATAVVDFFYMITFRPLSKKDIPCRVAWLNNPKVNKYLGQSPGQRTTLKKQEEWFAQYKRDKQMKFFTILGDDKPIGFMGFSNIDPVNKNANIILAIGDDQYRGRGVGKLALRFLVEYGFKTLKLHKINAGVIKENKAAVQLNKSLGFVTEGAFKDEAFFGAKFHDQLSMALFKKAYKY